MSRSAESRPRTAPPRLTCQNDPVPTLLLGSVQRVVGACDEPVGGVAAAHGAAEAHRDGDLVPVHDERRVTDRTANTLQHISQLRLAAPGDDHEELLATEAPEAVVGPHDVKGTPHDLAEHGVTGRVAIGVVDKLEVVD
ncbi:MAG: hypothetical protein NTX16_12270, partial [Actinobacteria bacterium]|nr:hypothetical protein [Actinomycetota bacterium]